ncbi:MAG TPA: class I SAM-dependent methyltransferase [Chthoniobacterales bacterium]|jgi:predicted O-methyltransferase YrrM
MNESLEECFALMETLVQCRQQPISVRLRKIRHRYSMLHEDVLLLIYHLSKVVVGNILEIGPYLGGSTIAAGFGVRDSSALKTIVTVEPGGRFKHPRLSSEDILRDLKKNLARQDLAPLVTLVPGHSGKEETVVAVHRHLPPASVGLFIFDADAGIDRDLRLYRDLFEDRAWVVIDDYYSAGDGEKADRIRPRVDALVAAGELSSLGLYGWGTWIGRWCRR